MEGRILEGKKIIIFYNDGDRISRKDGICTTDSLTYICLDNWLFIPHKQIIRLEVKNG